MLARLYLSKNICYEIIYQKHNFLKSLFDLGLLLKLQKKVSNQKIEPKKDYENAKQNYQDDEEEYDLVQSDLTESKMIFVCQSNKMQRLYGRYAATLLLLDATYRTTKCSLPLYFLVVQTNVNYQVAAVIVCQEETTEMITKALSQIKCILIS